MEQNRRVAHLRAQIDILESQLLDLKQQLARAEETTSVIDTPSSPDQYSEYTNQCNLAPSAWRWPLNHGEYKRYGRQMILPEIGLQGQLNLRNASVLVVGVGGLGCPAAAYLAGAGVGTIGLLDGDTVELSNLHRQILHTTDGTGQLKVDSASERLRRSNPNVRYITYPAHLNPSNSIEIMKDYDVILDCTDNPKSRYLISDTAVLSGKPLVSASALRAEGQLMVLNNPVNQGPCYRCVFPKPPPAESVVSCGEGGILGPVVGVMGVLMALEAIKLLVSKAWSKYDTHAHGDTHASKYIPSMLLFSAYSNPYFRSIRLRGKRPNCVACSKQHVPIEDTSLLKLNDYTSFCGVKNPVDLLDPQERIGPKEMQQLQQDGNSPLILDVRETTQFDICHIDGSINIPYSSIESDWNDSAKVSQDLSDAFSHLNADFKHNTPIHVMCRFGNDSQLVVRKLKKLGLDDDGRRWIGDVRGGLQSWKRDVDPLWPEY